MHICPLEQSEPSRADVFHLFLYEQRGIVGLTVLAQYTATAPLSVAQNATTPPLWGLY